jgi:ABC-type tungstate transport system permease subunit
MPRSLRAAAALAAALLLFAPAAARADDPSTVTVVGTSDVSDSGLVANVLKPGFEAAYPQYHLAYSSMGTGAAITAAKNGVGSALIVHAASLENQFAADGYSNEQYGRALFWGDYVLLGPADDPAHVMTDAPHDIVTAFEKIAAAGAANQANFVSRGGTVPPGTGVQEHLIWARTTGVQTCNMSDATGGGTRPSTVAGGTCGAPGSNNPSWYHETNAQQGPNIDNADVCNYPQAAGECYVLTDRGTFQFKQSTNPPTATHLHIVTRNNDPAARGGGNFLVNSFHGYVVNPSKVPASANVNVAGATAFLNWVTSPAGQAMAERFLSEGGDAPFLGSAAPALTGTSLPASVNAGTPVTVTGNIHNVVPGTPSLSGEKVSIGTPAGEVASTTADAGGNYRLTFTPDRNGAYSVSTGQIARIEDASLNPVFADLLTPASKSVGTLTVQSAIAVADVRTAYRRATVSGTVAPGVHTNGIVTISARRTSKASFVNFAKAKVTGASYSIPVKLSPGKWEIQARFDDTDRVLSSVAATKTVTVPGASSVKLTGARAGGRKLTVRGSVSPAPASPGGYVKLLTRRAGKGSYRAVGRKVKLAKGRRTFSIEARVGGSGRWQVEVEYVHKGTIDSSRSRARSVRVK